MENFDTRLLFVDRKDAGRALAKVLVKYKEEQPLLLAIPIDQVVLH